MKTKLIDFLRLWLGSCIIFIAVLYDRPDYRIVPWELNFWIICIILAVGISIINYKSNKL